MPDSLSARVRELPSVTSLVDHVKTGRPTLAGGLWGSASVLIASAVYQHLSRPVLFVLPTAREADEAEEDLATFLGSSPERFAEYDTGDPVDLSQRLRAVQRLQEGAFVVASARAVLQTIPTEGLRVELKKNLEYSREKLLQQLSDSSLVRTHAVEQPGEYAVRGGLVDLYPYGLDVPLRVDFFGDRIDSVRAFDLDSQRSEDELELIVFSLQDEKGERTIADCLPADAWVALREPAEVREEGWSEMVMALSRRPKLILQTLPGEGTNFRTGSIQRFSGALGNIAQELSSLEGNEIQVYCATEGDATRLKELLKDTGVSHLIQIVPGRVNKGFVWTELNVAVLPHHELFNRYRFRRSSHSNRAPRRSGTLDPFLELEEGDLVVHLTHGIGRFLRMEELKGQDHFLLEYHGAARLYVSTSNADLIQKYLGGSERAPALSALGGKAWKESKARAQKSAEKLAQEMLHVQAMRELETGIPYPPQTDWQRAFEAAFPFEETPDQIEVAKKIEQDMSALRPMDRLICGDVGYGKTELAMRAAFRAVAMNKQVAMLVPTTVLAQQHYQTFRERFADYPFLVEVISRFKTKGAQRRVLDDLEAGKVDIVIGTHRLVQKDVRFKELGLVIIDEEQRFGVEHKERLKQFRATVDVVTLSATPIPRTLHMSLLGIKDISSLTTAPQDRRAIRTDVMVEDDRHIADAIRFELSRGGQVYFVHNRVWNIKGVASHLQTLVPEARFAIGHGQMDAHELEETMIRFLNKEVDVLVATTIIESGLDIPNVNTIFIHDADIFGLADLHQLRGRVGRYHHQAYCYLLLPRDRRVLPQAKKRIKAIEEFSELGSGFKIAMRDLEIRGVGNLLGREQSGHILTVGYELYCRMLERAVHKAQKKPFQDPVDTVVELGVEARIPAEYISDLKTRIEMYRRLSGARDLRELETARLEVEDRFGRMPAMVGRLMQVLAIRRIAGSLGISQVVKGNEAVVCQYRDRDRVEPLRRRHRGEVRIVDDQTLHLVLDGSPLLDRVMKLMA